MMFQISVLKSHVFNLNLNRPHLQELHNDCRQIINHRYLHIKSTNIDLSWIVRWISHTFTWEQPNDNRIYVNNLEAVQQSNTDMHIYTNTFGIRALCNHHSMISIKELNKAENLQYWLYIHWNRHVMLFIYKLKYFCKT